MQVGNALRMILECSVVFGCEALQISEEGVCQALQQLSLFQVCYWECARMSALTLQRIMYQYLVSF